MQTLTVRKLETESPQETKMLFWFLFAGSRGAPNRIRIISLLRNRPSNANQITSELGLDYKGIKHHLRILEENNLISKIGEKYGATYFVSQLFERSEQVFDEIVEKIKAGRNRK